MDDLGSCAKCVYLWLACVAVEFGDLNWAIARVCKVRPEPDRSRLSLLRSEPGRSLEVLVERFCSVKVVLCFQS